MLTPPSHDRLHPSPLQRRIVEFIREGSGHGVVEATAGAGKTSTLVMVAQALPPGIRSCFLAFGRDAAAELSARLPRGHEALTVHKLGRRTLAAGLRRRGIRIQRVEQGKYLRLLRQQLPPAAAKVIESTGRRWPRHPTLASFPSEAAGEWEEYVARLLQLVRLDLVDASDEAAVIDLARRHVLPPPVDPELQLASLARLRQILHAGVREAVEQGIVDFTDMLHLPLLLDLPPPRYDFVCVDEAQDYSMLALAFTRRLIRPDSGGRLLFVGDRRQTIFAFAGAQDGALDRIVSETGATRLPLSISYRCPRSHVALARLLAPEMEARPDAGEGRVYWVSEQVLEHWAREGDLVLCRANAPLMGAWLRLTAAGRRARIRGLDLAARLRELAASLSADGETVAPSLLAGRISELRSRRGRLADASHMLDLLACLHQLITEPGFDPPITLRQLGARTEKLFGGVGEAVTLSTVHRAKGQEADRVLILYPETIPAPYARSHESLRGELCVQFVALTRSRRDLVFVSGGGVTPGPGRTGHQKWLRGVRGDPAESHLIDPSGRLSWEDTIGQGPGPWREVLLRARLLAQRRGRRDPSPAERPAS